ncbi:MAG: sulfite exporter TauE/SafE family protein [Candidatus Omnitrophota bacterium]
MELHSIAIATVAYYLAGIISVSVGGASLVTIPLLIFLGMSGKAAIATNMFTLIFLSVSGAVGLREKIEPKYTGFIAVSVVLTAIGSLIGARYLIAFNEHMLEKFLAVIIFVFIPIFFLNKDLGIKERTGKASVLTLSSVGILVFMLGVYGGFFSGGYMMLLSYVLILGLGLDFLQTAVITKILNAFSSLAACMVFFGSDLIDMRIALPLSISISIGAFSGSKLALRKGTVWVRKAFITVAVLLAVKLLFL